MNRTLSTQYQAIHCRQCHQAESDAQHGLAPAQHHMRKGQGIVLLLPVAEVVEYDIKGIYGQVGKEQPLLGERLEEGQPSRTPQGKDGRSKQDGDAAGEEAEQAGVPGVALIACLYDGILVAPEHANAQNGDYAGEDAPFAKGFLRVEARQDGRYDDRNKVHQYVARRHLQRISIKRTYRHNLNPWTFLPFELFNLLNSLTFQLLKSSLRFRHVVHGDAPAPQLEHDVQAGLGVEHLYLEVG